MEENDFSYVLFYQLFAAKQKKKHTQYVIDHDRRRFKVLVTVVRLAFRQIE